MGDNEGAVTTMMTKTIILVPNKIVTNFGKENNKMKVRKEASTQCYALSWCHGGGASLIIQANESTKSPYDDNKNNEHILKLMERIISKGHLSTNNGRRIRRR